MFVLQGIEVAGPHDLSMITHELGGCKSDVQIAQVEKGLPFVQSLAKLFGIAGLM
jgi:hypothetical protein